MAFMAKRGIDPDDGRLVKLMSVRVGRSMRAQRGYGQVLSEDGPGQMIVWRVAPVSGKRQRALGRLRAGLAVEGRHLLTRVLECYKRHCPVGGGMATLTARSSGVGSMTIGTILLIILILILIGVIPTWPHSRGWGYAPGGIVGVILIILLILLLMGRI
jgi:hypothetical protein